MHHILIILFFTVFSADAGYFLQGGLGLGKSTLEVQDFNLNKTFKQTSSGINYKIGIGNEVIVDNIILSASLQFLGYHAGNDFKYKDGSYTIELMGTNNIILLALNAGYKLDKFEPYLFGGLSFFSFSPKVITSEKEIQNNYLNRGFTFGIGMSFLYSKNVKFFTEFFTAMSINDGNSKLQKGQLRHAVSNVGIKYYF